MFARLFLVRAAVVLAANFGALTACSSHDAEPMPAVAQPVAPGDAPIDATADSPPPAPVDPVAIEVVFDPELATRGRTYVAPAFGDRIESATGDVTFGGTMGENVVVRLRSSSGGEGSSSGVERGAGISFDLRARTATVVAGGLSSLGEDRWRDLQGRITISDWRFRPETWVEVDLTGVPPLATSANARRRSIRMLASVSP